MADVTQTPTATRTPSRAPFTLTFYSPFQPHAPPMIVTLEEPRRQRTRTSSRAPLTFTFDSPFQQPQPHAPPTIVTQTPTAARTPSRAPLTFIFRSSYLPHAPPTIVTPGRQYTRKEAQELASAREEAVDKASEIVKHNLAADNPLPGQVEPPEPPVEVEPPEPPVEVRGEQEWEVKEIINSKLVRGVLKHQAIWKGYDQDRQWYNASGFVNAPEIVKAYHDRYPEKPGPPIRLKQWLKAKALAPD